MMLSFAQFALGMLAGLAAGAEQAVLAGGLALTAGFLHKAAQQ